MDISPEQAKECREDAKRKYQDELQKLGLQMMMMGYYKVKSLLTIQGISKVSELDKKRELDQDFNRIFSEKLWKGTEEAWGQALGQLMVKISDCYGLNIGEDIRESLPDDDI
tara:strand:- start:282 stop:617 length:336 start_codon:yes stop_codon:yes gene_type:complete